MFTCNAIRVTVTRGGGEWVKECRDFEYVIRKCPRREGDADDELSRGEERRGEPFSSQWSVGVSYDDEQE